MFPKGQGQVKKYKGQIKQKRNKGSIKLFKKIVINNQEKIEKERRNYILIIVKNNINIKILNKLLKNKININVIKNNFKKFNFKIINKL